MDECASNPCVNGAECFDSRSIMEAQSNSGSWESTTNASIPVHAFRCECVAGFADGVCEYDFVSNYTEECAVMDSSALSEGGLCGVDVDECASNPCANVAGSTSCWHGVDEYACICGANLCGSTGRR